MNKLYKNKHWLNQRYIIDGYSIRDVAKFCGVSYDTIWYWTNKFSIKKRTLSESQKTYHKKHPHIHSGSWRGGKAMQTGYISTWVPNHPCVSKNGRVSEQRLVVERAIGRYLKPNEIVHHINEVKTDNCLENLLVCTRAQHLWMHKRLRGVL